MLTLRGMLVCIIYDRQQGREKPPVTMNMTTETVDGGDPSDITIAAVDDEKPEPPPIHPSPM